MSKLSDVQNSQNGTLDAPALTREDALLHIPEGAAPMVAPPQEFVVFKLASHKGSGSFRVDGIDDVIQPGSITEENPRGKTVRIRLISGVDSIWLKDQKEVSDDYIKKNRRSLEFFDKVCRIPVWDTAALEFARNTRHCIGNPSHRSGSHSEFFEWNPKRMAEEQMKKRHLKVDAMKQALTIDVEKMRKHALYLQVSFTDEVGLPKTDDQLRNDYVLKAEENPVDFMSSLNDPIVSISFLVKKAIRDTKIDLGRQPNTAHWATGGLITRIPQARQASEYLIELANTNSEEGKRFLDQLQNVTK